MRMSAIAAGKSETTSTDAGNNGLARDAGPSSNSTRVELNGGAASFTIAV